MDTTIENQLPRTTEFVVPEDVTKNATKIVVDMDANAPFINELKAKIEACNDPVKAKEMEDEFEKATGISFDDAIAYSQEKETVIIKHSDGSMSIEKKSANELKDINDAIVLKHDENTIEDEIIGDETSPDDNATIEHDMTDEESEENSEFQKKVLDKLDAALKDPYLVMITLDDINKLKTSNLLGLDNETIDALVEDLNGSIKALIDVKDGKIVDPDSPVHNSEAYREAIKSSLEIKVSLEEALLAADKITDPAFIQELFEVKYPGYILEGPAFIIKQFNEYLEGRINNKDSLEFLYKELMDKKKIQKIIKYGDDDVFKFIPTKNGMSYNAGAFLSLIVDVNRERLATIWNLDKDTLTSKDIATPISIFGVLFIRRIYKNIVPNISTRKMEKKYFVGFLTDLMYSNNVLNSDKQQLLNSTWDKTWELVKCIEDGLESYIASLPKE